METPTIPYLKSWLLFFLVATVGGAILGAVIGAIIGFFLGAAGIPMPTIVLVTAAVSFLASLPISFFTFQWSVRTWIVNPLLLELARHARP